MFRSWLSMAVVAMGVLGIGHTGVYADVVEEFSAFATKHFGVRHEPLTTQLPGDELKFLDDGGWQYVSEDSATVAAETSLPAVVYVEYGPTKSYGSRTAASDRPYYVHVHSLSGLKTGSPVHYRVVATDERGKKVMSADKTLTPKKVAGAIYLLQEGGKALLALDKAGATYVLKSDLVAPGTALSVTAAGVTVDLNGFTVTYNDVAGPSDAAAKDFGALATQGSQGVRCGYAARGSTKIYNGVIRQGRGNGGYGHVPILARAAEIAGVTLDYAGPQVSGIDGEAKDVHHNVIVDRGSELSNRHQGVQGVGVNGNVHHNLFKRVRQRGVNAASGAKIYRNEIYVDSCTTNSFGIMMYKTRGNVVTDNRVFGRGYLAIGIGTVSEGVGDIKVARNFIHMQSHAPDNRWAEYGEQSGAYCVRVTWGGENVEYADNVMVSKGRDGGMVRGVWFCPGPKIVNVSFRRNTIKVLSETPETTDRWGAIVVSGEDNPDSKPGLFEDNTIISNFCNVRLGEEYGTGKNARFVRNTFVRAGDAPNYATVVCGFGSFNNNGSVFLDSKLEGGADLANVRWEGTGDNSYAVGTTAGSADKIDKTFKQGGVE